jgi:starvation-inducible DNA-binding protein
MTTTTYTTSVNHRRDENSVSNFTASSSLAEDLQRVLVDLIELHLQGKQAHWNVVGTNFRDLHLQLDELVDFAREGSDTIAERMRALDAVPDGRSDTVATTTSLPQFPADELNTAEVVDLIATRTYATVDTLRTVHDAVDAEDPSTADILHDQIDGLEKLAWLIKSEIARSNDHWLCGVNRWLPSMPDESQRLAHRAVQRLLVEMARSYTSPPPQGRRPDG